MKIWGVLLLLIFFSFSAFSAEMYVISETAPVYSSPKLSAEKVGYLKKGELVQTQKFQNNWFNIEANGMKGWVYMFMLNKKPPLDATKISLEEAKSIKNESRLRPSTLTVAAAARGFRENRERLKGSNVGNYENLKKMESFKVKPKDLEEFIRGIKQ